MFVKRDLVPNHCQHLAILGRFHQLFYLTTFLFRDILWMFSVFSDIIIFLESLYYVSSQFYSLFRSCMCWQMWRLWNSGCKFRRLSLADFIPCISSLCHCLGKTPPCTSLNINIVFFSILEIFGEKIKNSFRDLYWNSIISYSIYLCSLFSHFLCFA